MTTELTDGMRRRLGATSEVVWRIRRLARHHVADVFAADPDDPAARLSDLLDDIALVVGELVGNAVRNTCTARGTVDVDVACVPVIPGKQTGAVRICVWDDSPESVPIPPERPDPDELVALIDELDEAGRGLLITRMCVVYLDVVRDGERGGKWVRALMLVHTDSRAVEAPPLQPAESPATVPGMAIAAEYDSCGSEEADGRGDAGGDGAAASARAPVGGTSAVIERDPKLVLLIELCRELAGLGLGAGMSDAGPAVMVPIGRDQPLCITVDTSRQFFEWHDSAAQHPVADPAGAAARISEYLKTSHAGPVSSSDLG